MGLRRPLVTFCRLSLQSDFKKSPTGISTRGCRGFIGGSTEDLQKDTDSCFRVERVAEY